MLQQMAGGPPLCEMPVEDARAALKAATLAAQTEPQDLAAVEDITISASDGYSLPLRIYRNEVTSGGGEIPEVVLFLHGGGWVLGDLDTHDIICRWICQGADLPVVSVGYRLAPEYPFPQGLEDCVTAAKWIRSEAAAFRTGTKGGSGVALTVIGDSAGGNLAAVLAQMNRVENMGIDRQVLLYPCVDTGTDSHYPSRETFGDGSYFLGMQDLRWLRELYFSSPPAPQDARHSPIYAQELSGLPEALVITAGCDMLRDEALQYVRKMEAAGNGVTYREFPGAIHGFCSFQGVLSQGREALDVVCAWLRAD